MSTPTGDPDTGATKPMLMFRASAEGAGFDDNSIAATAEIAIIATIIKASIFLFKFASSLFFLCYI
jgi:hypothetical protein